MKKKFNPGEDAKRSDYSWFKPNSEVGTENPRNALIGNGLGR
jgi:hypothetical protein